MYDYDDDPVFINTTPAMVLAGFTLLCACLPGGIASLMLAQSAKTAAAQGDAAGAQQKLTYSYICSGICLLLGIPISILYIFASTAGY